MSTFQVLSRPHVFTMNAPCDVKVAWVLLDVRGIITVLGSALMELRPRTWLTIHISRWYFMSDEIPARSSQYG